MSELEALTESQLKAAAVSPIGYELDMMAHTATRWRAERAKPDSLSDAVAEIAFLESMLVHARSLIEFLARGRKLDTDLHRDDYVGAWNLGEDDKARCDGYYADMNKHLAHLTRDRLHAGPGDAPKWLDSLAPDVVQMFEKFLAELKSRHPEVAGAFAPTMMAVHARLSALTALHSRPANTTTDTFTTISSTPRPSTFDPSRFP